MDWGDLRDSVQQMHEAREQVLVRCRKLGQLSAKSIRHVHRHQFSEAKDLLLDAQAEAASVRELLAQHPTLNPSYLHDTEKEMVEAACVLAIVRGQPLPSAAELGAQVMAYLHGACEAASEVRRFVLDLIREGKMQEAERILAEMDAIYEELVTFDFPDSLTNGLRRAVDALRAVLERTRSDLTLTATQQQLIVELRRGRGSLEG